MFGKQTKQESKRTLLFQCILSVYLSIGGFRFKCCTFCFKSLQIYKIFYYLQLFYAVFFTKKTTGAPRNERPRCI